MTGQQPRFSVVGTDVHDAERPGLSAKFDEVAHAERAADLLNARAFGFRVIWSRARG